MISLIKSSKPTILVEKEINWTNELLSFEESGEKYLIILKVDIVTKKSRKHY